MGKEQIRVGVIGAGFISNYHIPGLQEAGAEVVVLSDLVKSKAQQQAERYGVSEITVEYHEVLSREDIDAVVIVTPDFTHEEIAVASARAGKAILLQKPMARSSQECLNIIAAAEKAGVPLFVSFMHRHFIEVEKVQALLAEGALGKIHLVRQRNATPGADWSPWFFSKEKVGGGVVLQLGVHGIDLLRQLFGEIEAVKATTTIVQKRRTLTDGSTVVPNNEDLAVAVYRFTNGALAIHEMAYNEVAGTDRFRMEIYGLEGTAWLRTERGRLAVYAPAYLGREGWFEPNLPAPDFGRRQHQRFLAMLRGDEPPDLSSRDGLVAVQVAEAIYRSADSGEWEEVA